jgi:hypothetical protein
MDESIVPFATNEQKLDICLQNLLSMEISQLVAMMRWYMINMTSERRRSTVTYYNKYEISYQHFQEGSNQ